jgi:hypothetical protein
MSTTVASNDSSKMSYKPIESPPSQVRTEPINDAPYPPVPAYDELTEEERVEYEKGILTWSKVKNWRFWIRKEWVWYYVLFVLLVVVVALMAFFHHSVSLPELCVRGSEGLMIDHQLVNAICAETPAVEIRMVDTCCNPICPLFSPIIR